MRKRIYLDSASTTLKPKPVINAVVSFYKNYTANVHRGIYFESEKATLIYEKARGKMAKFLNVATDEIIFTKNTTESINLVAKTWGKSTKNPKIVSTIMEHHSNLLPWQELGAKIVYLDIDNNGELDLSGLDDVLKGASLLAITHVSNVLGTINPVEEITRKAHRKGALVLIDGAQAVGHMRVDVKKIGCDFYVFSGHKMLGPSGVGGLWMRKSIAEVLPPFLTGGGMVDQETPHKFEAGTPNIEGVIGLGAAIDILQKIGIEKIEKHEQKLTEYAIRKLSEIHGLTIYGPRNNRAGIIAFNLAGIHPHDLASFLDSKGIAIRAGNHCASILHKRLGINSSARISFYIYNSKKDIDKLIESIKLCI